MLRNSRSFCNRIPLYGRFDILIHGEFGRLLLSEELFHIAERDGKSARLPKISPKSSRS